MKFPKGLLTASGSGASGGDVGEAVDGPGGGVGGGVSWADARQLNKSQKYCNVDMVDETNSSKTGPHLDHVAYSPLHYVRCTPILLPFAWAKRKHS